MPPVPPPILLSLREHVPGDAPDGLSQVTYRIDLGAQHYDVFIRARDLPAQPGLEACLPLALLAGMRLGRPVRVCGPLSATFLAGVRQVVMRFAEGFEEFQPIAIEADSTYLAEGPRGPRRAAFFSGGVDSFFTVLKGREQLTDLIYIHGFDVRLDDLPRRAAIHQMGHAVAGALGMRFIEVESNLAKVLQDFGHWAQHGHGFALAAVARALTGGIGEVRIPGTHSLKHQKPWGSWLETDPLFSDERLRVVHDACESGRADKLRALIREPLALQYLRVCWEKVDGMYNCCHCEKCLRTMVSLHAHGVLDQSTAFRLPLEARRVRHALLPREGLRIYLRENIALMRELRPDDKALIAALETQLHRPIWVAQQLLKWRKRRWRLQMQWRRLVQRLSSTG